MKKEQRKKGVPVLRHHSMVCTAAPRLLDSVIKKNVKTGG